MGVPCGSAYTLMLVVVGGAALIWEWDRQNPKPVVRHRILVFRLPASLPDDVVATDRECGEIRWQRPRLGWTWRVYSDSP